MSQSVDVSKIQDFGWFHNHLKILDYEDGQFVTLRPNAIQWRIREAILDADRKGEAARLIILKSRRVGCSTIIQATLAHRAFTRQNYSGITIAHERENAEYLHKMTENMYRHLPAALQVGKSGNRTGKFLDLKNGSSLRVDTARDPDAGRGTGVRFLHASEVAMWPDAKNTMVAIRSTVPRQPGTCVVIESTARGVGNHFHAMWQRAVDLRSGFTPLFFGWHEFPHYRIKPPEWFAREPDLSDLERALKAGYGLDLGQLWWRRQWIAGEVDGDEEMFAQEYPLTAEEAFLNSGMNFFRNLAGFVPQAPALRGYIQGVFKKNRNLHFEHDPKGPLKLWTVPDKTHRYVMFVDPAGQVTPNDYDQFTDKKDAEDYTVGVVIDCHTGETVAVWRGRYDPDVAAEELAKLGRLYGKAEICVEMNGGYGSTFIVVLRALGYPNLYRSRNEISYKRDRRAQWGWTTTQITRPIMLDGLKQIIRETPHVLKDADLKRECGTFIIGRSGKPEADKNSHDDLVMAFAGAYAIYRERAIAPMRPQKSRPSTYVPTVSQR